MERTEGIGRRARLVALLAACALLLLVAKPAYAAEVAGGEGWSLDDSGVLTLSGDIAPIGAGGAYEWEPYATQIKEVSAAEGVTEIPNMAFATRDGVSYSSLQKVSMSSTVRTIGVSAFADNPTLTEVHLNDGLERVENVAFGGAGFSEIELPQNVLWLSDVFIDCDSLVSVTIPAGSAWGGGNAQFYGCDSLETVYIEEGVTQIPPTFLNGCGSLKYVWVPKSVTDIQGTPILGGCIVGYTGTAAEEYADWRQEVGVNAVDFHAIDGSEHAYGEWQTVAAPTCTESGEQARACSVCGAQQSQELAATGHSWGSGTVTKEPTESAEGIRTFTCSACGQAKTEPIAKLPQQEAGEVQGGGQAEQPTNSESGSAQKDGGEQGAKGELPQTGDNTLALVGLPLVALAFVSAGAALVARRRIQRR